MQLQAHKDAIALSDKRRLEADLRKRDDDMRKQGEDMRVLLQRMAAIEARAGAATVKTEHGEGDIDKPKTKDGKMPGMADDPKEGQGAPRDSMPSMLRPLPSAPPPYTGSKHYEGVAMAGSPARVVNIQGDNELPTSSGPTDPCLSVHAGTGSPDMNELTRPSASEESVTSRVRNASQGSTHQQAHQEHEHQEPDIDANTSGRAGDAGTDAHEADGVGGRRVPPLLVPGAGGGYLHSWCPSTLAEKLGRSDRPKQQWAFEVWARPVEFLMHALKSSEGSCTFPFAFSTSHATDSKALHVSASSPLNDMPKIIVTVMMPSKGNKVVLNQFINEPTAFDDESIEQFYDTKVVPNIDEAAGAGPLHKAAVVLRGGEKTRTQTRGVLPSCLAL